MPNSPTGTLTPHPPPSPQGNPDWVLISETWQPCQPPIHRLPYMPLYYIVRGAGLAPSPFKRRTFSYRWGNPETIAQLHPTPAHERRKRIVHSSKPRPNHTPPPGRANVRDLPFTAGRARVSYTATKQTDAPSIITRARLSAGGCWKGSGCPG